MNYYYTYILSSARGTLYTGVTNDIWIRMLEHKSNEYPGFTSKYHVTKLIYYEETNDEYLAIMREKEIKGWNRRKKLELGRTQNPYFNDLSENWYSGEDY